MKPTQIIGSNIKRIREQRGIKQETLAKQIGITKGRMSQIESGECDELSISRLAKIAGLLNVDFFEVVTPLKVASDSNGINGFNHTSNNLSLETIKAIANELVNRMSKLT
jgi:transcriptional regulator with XRE-family HTH domain